MKVFAPVKHSRSIRRSVICVAFAALCLVAVVWSGRKVRAQGAAGSISFSQAAYSVNEGGGSATITLTRTGGSSGKVVGKVGLTDITTSPSDYNFKPGSFDSTFPTMSQGTLITGYQSMALQPDGKIILAALTQRLNRDGTVDSTFHAPAFSGPPWAVAVQPDGKIVFVGGFTTVGGLTRNGVVRLNSDGSLDTSFDVGIGASNVEDLAFQADGKIVVGGLFSDFSHGANTANVARLNPDGSLDSTFVKGTNVSSTYAVAVQSDGKILMGGWGLARLNPDGSVDNTFNCQLGAVIETLLVQPDGKILAGGSFNHAGSQNVFCFARINADGSLDTTFNAGGSGPSSSVITITTQPDGKLLIGGYFDSYNGVTQPRIARLNPDGTLDSTFAGVGSSSGTEVDALLVQDDGKVVADGFFTLTTNPLNFKDLARFNGDLFVTWNDGDTANKTVSLPIVDDLIQESNETLGLSLTPVSGGATGGAITNATLTINDNDVAPLFTSNPPPQGITRTPYSHTFTASGVPAPTFSVTAGNLPPGLFLQGSGLLSGTPQSAGTFNGITVTASNGVAPAATQTFSITILSGGNLQFESSAYTVAENAGSLTVKVIRTGGSAGSTSVNYSTGSSGAGIDFTTTTGTLVFADGETSKTFNVPILNDNLDEDDEVYPLTLSNVTGSGFAGTPSQAFFTIVDDDPPPSITISDAVMLEGNTVPNIMTFLIRLSAPSGKTISGQYVTHDGTALGQGVGTHDFTAVLALYSIPPGTTQQQVSIQLLPDTTIEPDETFTVSINAQNATLARDTATGYIVNDDNGSGNPIDLPGFYVYRQYNDFLNRNPDGDGFNFWKNTITQCGTDLACTDVQRVNASGAFFLAIEFQQTGYLVERIYKTAYGDASATSTFGGSTHQVTIPTVRFSEFTTDSAQIAAGLVVLQTGWEQVLENNKQSFANSFVQRSRFLTDYPTAMPPLAFVEKLNQRAGSPLSASERDQLVTDLSTSVKTRAQVLRAIAEHPNLVASESNRAFVLMQYFGYLRRNPSDSPDTDYTGYDFWLTKLNQFNGDYVAAEMVKAFINSGEYRKRFGP